MIYLLSTHYQDIYYINDKKIFVSFHKSDLNISFVLSKNKSTWFNSDDIDLDIKRDEYIADKHERNTGSIRDYTYSMLETILLDKIIENI